MVFEPLRAPPRKHLPPGERRPAGSGTVRGRKPLGGLRWLPGVLQRDNVGGSAARELGKEFRPHRAGSNTPHALGEGDPSGRRTKTQSSVLARTRLPRSLARYSLLTSMASGGDERRLAGRRASECWAFTGPNDHHNHARKLSVAAPAFDGAPGKPPAAFGADRAAGHRAGAAAARAGSAAPKRTPVRYRN